MDSPFCPVQDYEFRINGSMIHSSAQVEGVCVGNMTFIRENVRIGHDTRIGAQCCIEKDVIIGERCNVQSKVYIPSSTEIGSDVFIGPCVAMANDPLPTLPKDAKKPLRGPIIASHAIIGAGAILLPGVKIGEYAFVGAGSVVTRDVPDGDMYLGNPASYHMRTETYFGLKMIKEGNNE